MERREIRDPGAEPPLLSVVVVPLGGRGDLAACLRALRRQDDPPPFEVIVPHDDTNVEITWMRDSFPEARFLGATGWRTPAELRAIGVQAGRGAIVALTEDHCRPDPNWLREIARAHERRHAGVGGAVEKRSPASALAWAFYLSDYGRYIPPVREGASSWMTDCNSSYKRSTLESIRSCWSREFHETTVNWTLQSRGETLFLSPRVVVDLERNLTLGEALRDRLAFGRLFASTRVAAIPRWKRLAYAAASPLIPFVRTGRVVANVTRKRRCVGPFFRALPAMLVLDTVWACGELLGYVTGSPGRRLRGAEPR